MVSGIRKISLSVLALAMLLPACNKKDDGLCTRDIECPEGNICRDGACIPDPAKQEQAAKAEAAAANPTENAAAEDAPKEEPKPKKVEHKTPVEINAEFLAENNLVLEDLGLGIDYILNEQWLIDGTKKIEIGPDVTIDMRSSSANIVVADDAALKINGTEQDPVIFKSTNASAWSGITIRSTNKDNSMNYLQIIHADGEDFAVHITDGARVSMDHVTIDGSSKNGLVLDGDASLVKFSNNTIKNCEEFPIVMNSIMQTEKFGDGNKFESNTQNMIRIEGHWYDAKNSTIANIGIPYFLADGFNDDTESGTLTIKEGVQFVLEHNKFFRVGDSVQLKIEGTKDAPVKMRGAADEANFWEGLKYDSTRPGSINYLELANTGNNEHPSLVIRDNAKIDISNITFKATEHRCLEIGGDSKVVNKGGLVFEKCDKGNVFDHRIEGDEDKQIIEELPIEPGFEEAKAEEVKPEEAKAEEPKAEEAKAEEPKAEEAKADEPKAEEPKADEPKAEEAKAEEAKAE